MTFIVTLVALIIERFFHWSHLRHWNWFARYQHFLTVRFGSWPKYLLLAACILPPVILIALLGGLVSHSWYGVPKLIFGVAVVVYCLGPNNLWLQIYSCIRVLNKEDTHAAITQVKTAFGITSVDQPQAFHQAFTRAIFIAANQRIFAVLFWYSLLGPGGAILYRLMSLCASNVGFSASASALQMQQLLDWLPARVFAFIFALGGNFTKVFNVWKKQVGDGLQSNATLLGDCGIAALDVVKSEQIPEDGTAENEALTLLDRVLVMSLVVLAMIVIVT